jgi:hypothetical protein
VDDPSTAKVLLIDPTRQQVHEIDSHHIESLISGRVGEDAECLRLDSENVICVSDIDTNDRYAYYLEMPYPFDGRALFQGSNRLPWKALGAWMLSPAISDGTTPKMNGEIYE